MVNRQSPISSLLNHRVCDRLPPWMTIILPLRRFFALSSAAGKAGVAVIRVSGAQAWKSLDRLAKGRLPEPRKTKLMTLISPKTGDLIDHAMVIGFKGLNSFTGEDVIEYHCHGSPAILEELLSLLGKMEGHRMANHGEFTRRAFENGKLDLTEAEAIADLIDAETKMQKEQALSQMGGALSSVYNGWAEELTRALAYVETIIDFPDEDVPDTETAKATPSIQKLQEKIEIHLNDNRRGERLRNGIHIAVIGAPNAGKSSLVNLLAERDIAIVSDMAGTTRDVIEAHLNLGGYPVILADTAGLRPDQIGDDGQEAVESEGIRRAIEKAKAADLRVLVFDASAEKPDKHTLDLMDESAILVANKSDLDSQALDLPDANPVLISTKTGENIDQLLSVLKEKIAKEFTVSRETPSLTRERHRQNLENCNTSLVAALTQKQPELMAQDLRFAVNELGRITGRVDVEDLLDVIFKDFCIGK